MREAKKIRLRHAYFGPLTLREIARANSIGEKMLERFWKAEKIAGRLDDVPRPYFARYCKPAPDAEAARAVHEDALADMADEIAADDDDSPIGDFNPRYDAQCDAALAALREHHPTAEQAPPAAWLREPIELVRQMPRTIEELHALNDLVPTHAQLMAMCRAADNASIVRRHLEKVPA